MQHVANNGHGEIAEVFFVMPDGVHVQQTLGRVCVAAVARIDHMHMRGHVLCDQVGRSGLAVAHDKNIRRHRAQIGNGVEQRLALGSR